MELAQAITHASSIAINGSVATIAIVAGAITLLGHLTWKLGLLDAK